VATIVSTQLGPLTQCPGTANTIVPLSADFYHPTPPHRFDHGRFATWPRCKFTQGHHDNSGKTQGPIQPPTAVSLTPLSTSGDCRADAQRQTTVHLFDFCLRFRSNHALPAPLGSIAALLIPRLKQPTTPEPIRVCVTSLIRGLTTGRKSESLGGYNGSVLQVTGQNVQEDPPGKHQAIRTQTAETSKITNHPRRIAAGVPALVAIVVVVAVSVARDLHPHV
jgi:hypothetical protein